ncbi:hypothetical protein SYNTR_0300 [Candidatus Syntrophocurvum alkaliphilum]|uniref:G5 domain-containing protein n=1 Tax=Candidatus Syntrophocurvum alkaliphilum TaxID=2293317 RepID=A0A6I6D6S0_9FIRM|nr:peptidoglycan binding domain-containing protein [Candidatus Syntrophocurvum alkaliphilum]QGT98893.1 hypothetical protein SYNTR_0300 [Candidatus Syntrophocurvum alkaliphilum]
MTYNKNFIHKVISLTLLVVLLTLTSVSYILADLDSRYYPSNFFVGNVSVAGMTYNDAFTKLQNEFGQNNLIIKNEKKEEKVSFDQIGITFKTNNTLEQLESYLNKEDFLRHIKIRGEKQVFYPLFNYCEENLYKELLKLKKVYDRPAIDAKVLIKENELVYTQEIHGSFLDVDATIKELINIIEAGYLRSAKAKVIVEEPEIYYEDIKNIKHLMGIYIASVDSINDKEVKQITSQLNETIIMPLEHFYLEKKFSEIDSSSKLNNIIKKGLYEASKTTGLEIIKKDKYKNLTLKNNLQNPIMLSTKFKEDKITIKIYGYQSQEEKSIDVVKEIVKHPAEIDFIIDKQLKPGERIIKQEGEPGKEIKTYKIISKEGKEIERSLLNVDYQSGEKTIILQGSDNK